MFESDDFDEVLSQFDIPETIPQKKAQMNVEEQAENCILNKNFKSPPKKNLCKLTESDNTKSISQQQTCNASTVSTNEAFSKHSKRKIIKSHFDQSRKRKFPGPAGLLSKTLEETKNESICHLELLSQDIDFTQNNLRRDLFDSPLWKRLNDDQMKCNLNNIDTINVIKQQAHTGNLRRGKAQVVAAFIEGVDRSVTDPLIILRDRTGSIKCTLHRDAWSTFSPYIVSEYCILVLHQPTVLTTGSAFKKHYLNITLSNINAVYSSVILKDNSQNLPDGYSIVYNEDFTVIKSVQKQNGLSFDSCTDSKNDLEFLDDLDTIFSDELF